MSRLAVPQRGQPLDVSLVYEIISSINELYTNTNRSTYSSLSSSMDLAQPNNVKTANAKIVTGLAKIETPTAGSETEVTFTFAGNNFSRPPIVTATPLVTNKSLTNVTVGIKSVTTSSVRLSLSVPSGWSGSVNISVIAIGEAV
jgi:hypothetical protein